jgi:flagellar motor switch protein FliN/FliY
MTEGRSLSLPEITATDMEETAGDSEKTAADLASVFDVPVNIQAVLGRTHLNVSNLLRLNRGSVLELDRRVGEPIDVYVNDRLIARGEVVIVDDRLGVTMTEIIKDGDST